MGARVCQRLQSEPATRTRASLNPSTRTGKPRGRNCKPGSFHAMSRSGTSTATVPGHTRKASIARSSMRYGELTSPNARLIRHDRPHGGESRISRRSLNGFSGFALGPGVKVALARCASAVARCMPCERGETSQTRLETAPSAIVAPTLMRVRPCYRTGALPDTTTADVGARR